MGICVGFEQTIKHKIQHVPLRHYDGFRTARPHKRTSTFHQCAGSFVHMKGYVSVRIMMNWTNVRHNGFSIGLLYFYFFFILFQRYCNGFQIAHPYKTMFPFVFVWVCSMRSLETSTHVIPMPESHIYYPEQSFLPNGLPTHCTNKNVVISDQHSHNPDKNVVISGMCRLKGNDNVVISNLKHIRCLVLVILYAWRKLWLGYAEYGWVRWDDTCGWWCVGQRRWISYTTTCMMKSKNDWLWVRWDETPPVHMHKMVVCKHKKKKFTKGLFWNIQEQSGLQGRDLPN